MIELTQFGGHKAVVFLDNVSYISRLDSGPCQSRIHFTGDRANSIDVLESIEDVLSMILEQTRKADTPDLHRAFNNYIG